jgi:hypothetical protein
MYEIIIKCDNPDCSSRVRVPYGGPVWTPDNWIQFNRVMFGNFELIEVVLVCSVDCIVQGFNRHIDEHNNRREAQDFKEKKKEG